MSTTQSAGQPATAGATLRDEQLMARAQAGAVDAFGELYDRYSRRAYRVALAVCRDHERAQDAVQDAFLAVWKSRASYRSHRGTVGAWLLTSVRHRAIDLVRHNAKQINRRAGDDHAPDRAAPDDVCELVIQRAEAAALHARLAGLPDAQQEVIALAFYGELSYTEIAAHLGLPAGTVKGRMRLGLQKLQADID